MITFFSPFSYLPLRPHTILEILKRYQFLAEQDLTFCHLLLGSVNMKPFMLRITDISYSLVTASDMLEAVVADLDGTHTELLALA
jgi:hypothetical protein